jgi:hypothetical protein
MEIARLVKSLTKVTGARAMLELYWTALHAYFH